MGRRRRYPFKHANPSPGCSPYSGKAPPVEHQWGPGQSGNPTGRPPTGATYREWVNALARRSPDEIRAAVADPGTPEPMRQAAELWLESPSAARAQARAPVHPELLKARDCHTLRRRR
jgi:hypothetical protein